MLKDQFLFSIDSKLHLIWSHCCYSADRSISAKSVQLLVQLVVQFSKQSSASSVPDLSQDAALAVESLILNLCSTEKTDEKQLKVGLSSAVQLSRASGQDICAGIVDSLTRLLLQSTGPTLLLICQALAAIGDTQPAAIVPSLVDVMSVLRNINGTGEHEQLAIPLFCVLIFQAHISHLWSQQANDVVNMAVNKIGLWSTFRIARSAARYLNIINQNLITFINLMFSTGMDTIQLLIAC